MSETLRKRLYELATSKLDGPDLAWLVAQLQHELVGTSKSSVLLLKSHDPKTDCLCTSLIAHGSAVPMMVESSFFKIEQGLRDLKTFERAVISGKIALAKTRQKTFRQASLDIVREFSDFSRVELLLNHYQTNDDNIFAAGFSLTDPRAETTSFDSLIQELLNDILNPEQQAPDREPSSENGRGTSRPSDGPRDQDHTGSASGSVHMDDNVAPVDQAAKLRRAAADLPDGAEKEARRHNASKAPQAEEREGNRNPLEAHDPNAVD